MKQKVQVHVADDHKILIEGIIAVINTDENIEISAYSLTGKEVTDWFSDKSNKADVLILDITMPILDGFEVLKYFNKKGIKQKVIILSSYDDLKIIKEMIALGCRGYITKKNAGEHIVKAIKAVANGEEYFSDDIKKLLLKSLSSNRIVGEKLPIDELEKPLTASEISVLKLITQEYSTPEMAEALNVSASTILTHRKSLLKKLNVKNSVGLAMYAVKNKII